MQRPGEVPPSTEEGGCSDAKCRPPRKDFGTPINSERNETGEQKKQMCIVFRHDSFPDQELHTVTRYAKVEKEGAEEHLFIIKDIPADERGGNNKEDEENRLQELPAIGQMGTSKKKLTEYRRKDLKLMMLMIHLLRIFQSNPHQDWFRYQELDMRRGIPALFV